MPFRHHIIRLLFNLCFSIISIRINDVNSIFFRFRNTACNRIQGSTDGIVFPSHIDKRVIFRVFRKAFCRPLPIVFKKEVWLDGIPGYLYTLADNFADLPDQNPDNECFCRREKSCLRKGLSDLTPCYYSTYPIKP